MSCQDSGFRQGFRCTRIILVVEVSSETTGYKKDEGSKLKELVKRMKLFNELLSDYLDAIDMEEVDTDKESEKEDK